jgi:hypothetical protein
LYTFALTSDFTFAVLNVLDRKFMQFMREHHAKDGQHKQLLAEIRPDELQI